MNEETEEVIEILLDYWNAQEASCVNAKQRIAKLVGAKTEQPSISEIDFLNQKYQVIKSDKIKGLECAFKNDNPNDAWQRCYHILKQNQATIKDHYAPEGFQYYYWQFEKYTDRYYRVKKAS